MRNFVLIIGALLMMIDIGGCAKQTSNLLPFERRIPGNSLDNTYGIDFDIDYEAINDDATYRYSVEGKNFVHGLGGGRFGYGRFGELIMDFELKDGRKFHEVLDFRALVVEMLQKYEIFNLAKTKFGGFAKFDIKIDNKRLVVDYVLTVIKNNNPYVFHYYNYPVYEKDFTGSGKTINPTVK